MVRIPRRFGASLAVMVCGVLGSTAASAAEVNPDVIEMTALRKPVVAHAAAAGWAEDPSLVVTSDFALVAYAVTEAGGSQIRLARLPRAVRSSADEASGAEATLTARGQIEFGPSTATDGEGGIWVAWTSCRDGAWAIRASRVRDVSKAMTASPEMVLSSPGGFHSQAEVAAGGGVACFVWVAVTPDSWRIVARVHDGELRAPFTLYEGRDPVGRPSVQVLDREHLLFAWDQYSDGQFAICRREAIGGQLGPCEILTGEPGSSNWEPSLAGRGANLVTVWHSVPAESVRCVPTAQVAGGSPRDVGTSLTGPEENWRTGCAQDDDGRVWVAWTTRNLYRRTDLYVRRVGPEGLSRACNIDFRGEKVFMNGFDCAVDGSLFVAWDHSGAIYLSEITRRELEVAGFLGDELRAERRKVQEAPPTRWPDVGPGPEAGPAEAGDISDGAHGEAVGADLAESWGAAGRAAGTASAGRTAALGNGAAGQAQEGPLAAYSIFYEGESLHVYFGDCHNHTSFSDGRAYPDMSLAVARDRRRLDFAAITDHDVTVTPGEYAWTSAVADILTEGGRFACLRGFEVSKGWAQQGFGHWNMLFAEDGEVLHFTEGMTPPDLYARAKAMNSILVPHHVAATFAPHDWTYFDPVAEPVVEICSLHGIFESGRGHEGVPTMVEGHFVEEGLRRGYVFGLIGGSDSHNCFAAALDEQGLAAVYAPSLGSQAIFDAMRARRAFALTGGGVVLDFRGNGRLMGEVLEARARTDIVTFTGYACSPDSIVLLEIVSAGQVVAASQARASEARLHWEVAAPDSQTYYYLRSTTAKGDLAWSSPIWIRPQR